MPEVHADGALWGRARKGWFSGTGGPVFYGVVPERGGFQARYRLHSALPSQSVQSEEGYLQRCGKVQFNFVAPQSEIGVIWQKLTEVRKE